MKEILLKQGNPVDNIDENNDDHNYNDKNQVSILSKVIFKL